MARKSKSKGNANLGVGQQVSGGGDRMNADISTAENGFIVNISGETNGKKPTYFQKRFIATSRPAAMRLAAAHFAAATGKKAGRKKPVGKR